MYKILYNKTIQSKFYLQVYNFNLFDSSIEEVFEYWIFERRQIAEIAFGKDDLNIIQNVYRSK